MPKKPEILNSRRLSPDEVAQRGLGLEEMHLRFSNGTERYYRRVPSLGRPAALIIPMLDNKTVLLIREYAAGLHEYQLQLPKGGVHKNESLLEAANRELKEEIGKGARRLTQINQFSILPGFMGQSTDIVLAEELFDERLPGDEPEELEVVPWDINKLYELTLREDCTEARSIAALYFARDFLLNRKESK